NQLSDRGLIKCRQALLGSREVLDPPPLITGKTLQEAGLKPGPNFKHWIQAVRDRQLDGELHDQAAALEFIRQLAANP
ncbi:MAG: hypothetical protein AAFV88_23455, partial [Planctomycetota bacterium]